MIRLIPHVLYEKRVIRISLHLIIYCYKNIVTQALSQFFHRIISKLCYKRVKCIYIITIYYSLRSIFGHIYRNNEFT